MCLVPLGMDTGKERGQTSDGQPDCRANQKYIVKSLSETEGATASLIAHMIGMSLLQELSPNTCKGNYKIAVKFLPEGRKKKGSLSLCVKGG